jgi:hypothetical protein
MATAPLDEESESLAVMLDLFDDSAQTLSVKGWGFRQDGDAPRQSLHLILESPDACYSFRATPVWRADVADTHGLAWDDPGFELTLDKSALRPGRYRLGLLVHSAGAQPLFKRLARECVVAEPAPA